MDKGAQRSFITHTLADKLRLQRDGTDVINPSSFGDPAHIVRRQTQQPSTSWQQIDV
ncbi:hypothetical protein DPMN_070170 [Dreissena polymorpha]|uniref:Uncharacterized protein n=1 Tax=Dreissena polymorpha TaxID=45954 RepID=A0A9D3Z2P8_DREPO|nr:hypothetical protein DPMN_070170 [Dreissena polymorpha]